MTAALRSGAATPETLFDWTVARRASDLVSTARLPLWDDYVLNRGFGAATQAALARRRAARD